jgi:hypothetical protein
MRRRDFVKGIAGSATWSLAARAQQPEKMRRIGVLMSWTAATCGSMSAGVRANLNALANTRRSWWLAKENDFRVARHSSELGLPSQTREHTVLWTC